EATWHFRVFPNNNFYSTWSYPVTSRVLFEAGASLRVDRQLNEPPDETRNARPVLDLTTGIGYGSQLAPFTSEVNYGDMGNQGAWQTRGSMSYVTGSHAFKVGVTTMTG